MMKQYAIYIALAVVAFIAVSSQSIGSVAAEGHGAIPVNSCGTLDTPGSYELVGDVQHSPADSVSCLVIGANDITFSNPGGYTISGQGRSESGIKIDSKTGVRIEGQIISHFDWGIHLKGDATNTVISGNTANNNTLYGIFADNAHGGDENSEAVIIDNQTNHNGDVLLQIYQGGISVVRSRNLIIAGNESTSNIWVGIYIASSTNITVDDNTITDNSPGLHLSGSDDNVVTLNEISDSRGTGLLVDSGRRNQIIENVITNSASVDARDNNGNTGGLNSNIWEFNTCDSSFPSDLVLCHGPRNSAPEATDDFYNVNEDNTLVVDAANGVLSNDFDPDMNSLDLSAELLGLPTNGSLISNPDGSFTYTPNLNYNGDDGFSYVANDGEFDSNEASVIISVSAVNDPPAADAGSLYSVPEGGVVGLSALGSLDVDDDFANLTFAWDLDADGVFDDATGPETSFDAEALDGPDSLIVAVEVCDPSQACDTALADVTVFNVAPVITDIAGPSELEAGSLVQFQVSFDDPGIDDTHSAVIYWGDNLIPDFRTIQNGSFLNHTYQQPGTFLLEVEITDDDGLIGNGAVELTVSDTTPPVISLLGPASITLIEGETYLDAGATAYDIVDGDVTGDIVVGGLPIPTDTVGTYLITYDVNDTAGNAGIQVTRTVVVELQEAGVLRLKDAVDELGLPLAIHTPSNALLDATIAALQRGQGNVATNHLSTFVRLLETHSGNRISEEDAQNLIEAVNVIIAAIAAS